MVKGSFIFAWIVLSPDNFMTLQGAPGDTGPTGPQGGLVSANGYFLYWIYDNDSCFISIRQSLAGRIVVPNNWRYLSFTYHQNYSYNQ